MYHYGIIISWSTSSTKGVRYSNLEQRRVNRFGMQSKSAGLLPRLEFVLCAIDGRSIIPASSAVGPRTFVPVQAGSMGDRIVIGRTRLIHSSSCHRGFIPIANKNHDER
jgi:hypothetical protein